MKKRILSILLAVALLLSVGVVPARAADSCVSVKADAATTAEVVAGDLLEIPLGDIFRDSDGHSLTYTLVNAAQFGTQTKVGGSTLYVSEKDPGTYEPKIKATCSGGKSVTATLTVTVKPAPHGLDAQYNYDESPAKEVTVYVTISNDGVPIRGRDGTILCHKAITVPYFDLSQYGLDEFYRYHTANGEGKYVDNNIVERPTGLHLYIYLLERYFIGLPEDQCCKGKYTRGDLEGFRLDDDVYYMDEDPAYTASLAALKITGSPTSLYMANFWGHDENLMYYRNHCYPYMSPGWGSTSDYILLSDGDTWDVAMFTNWSFYSSGGAFTCFDKDAYTVRPGTELTVTSKAYGTTFKDGDFYDFENLDVYLYSDSWEQLDMLKDAGSGKATFTFTVPKDEGTYYIVGFDPNRKIPTDDSGGTNYAKIAPATAILTVSGTAELERPFQTVSVDGKALDGKNISYEGIVSLGSEDSEEFRNVYEEVPKYHVIVPEGTQTVDITYGKDVDIYHADATAYGYETDLAADAVSSATIRSVTLESSYKANDDGTQTVATPVARYVRNADGTAMAVTLESGSGKNFRPVALFTFEYAKAEPDPEPEVKYGDVNGDSTIDVSDALLICQIYLANVTPTDAQKAAADVNGDGTADVSDALMVCQYYLGNITGFPAGKSK